MLADSLRIFELQPGPIAVLARSGFASNASVYIDRIPGPAQESLCQAAIRRKSRGLRSPDGDRLSGIPANEEPLAGLAFELQYILEVVIDPLVIGVELSDFSFHGQPRRRDGKV